MDKVYLRQIFNPDVKDPIFVQGLPGFGNVGKISAYLMVKFSSAKLFAELYSPSFPDYVSVSSKGTCRLPRYEFYAAPMEKNDFIIMTGDTQPSFDDVVAHYTLCDETLDFVQKYGCKFVVTTGGVPMTEGKA